MRCPKCAAEQPDGNASCDRCGIYFEKYWKYHAAETGAPTPRHSTHLRHRAARPAKQLLDEDDITREGGIRALLLPRSQKVDPVALWARAGLLLVLLVWGLSLIGSSVESNAAGKSFLHMINLPFHEAGHVIFRPFGAFITSLGGTLGQLLMPLICLGTLLIKTRDPFGAAVCLWWFGENFLDIAPYINDARSGTLPLIGGNFGYAAPYGFHDWEYILNESGLLHLDHSLAQASHTAGSLIMLSALSWAGLLLWRQWQVLRRQH